MGPNAGDAKALFPLTPSPASAVNSPAGRLSAHQNPGNRNTPTNV